MSDVARFKKQDRLILNLRAQARIYRDHIAALEAELARLRGVSGQAAEESAFVALAIDDELEAADPPAAPAPPVAPTRPAVPVPTAVPAVPAPAAVPGPPAVPAPPAFPIPPAAPAAPVPPTPAVPPAPPGYQLAGTRTKNRIEALFSDADPGR